MAHGNDAVPVDPMGARERPRRQVPGAEGGRWVHRNYIKGREGWILNYINGAVWVREAQLGVGVAWEVKNVEEWLVGQSVKVQAWTASYEVMAPLCVVLIKSQSAMLEPNVLKRNARSYAICISHIYT